MTALAVGSDIAARLARIDALVASLHGQRAQPATSSSTTATAGGAASAGTFADALAQAQAPGTAPAADASTLAGLRSIATGATTATAGAAATATATGASTGSAAAAGLPFGAEIDAAAQRNGVDPMLLAGLVRQESGFDPAARSGAGAVGLCQLMPATAAGLGVTDPTDPAQSLEGGARYLRQQLDRFGGDPAKALAAYNAGPGAVARYGGVPPYAETQNYVRSILGGLGSRT